MEKKDIIRILLALQEHPENFTDEQLEQLLADNPELADMMLELAMVKKALVTQDVEEETISVDMEWAQFAAEHTKELEELDKQESQTHHKALVARWKERLPFRIAASIIGFLLVAGVTFATIEIVRSFSRPSSTTEQQDTIKTTQTVTSNNTIIPIPADTVQSDTIPQSHPVLFDNVTLEKMLSKMAAYYQVQVEFLNDEARHLRFFFEWKQEDTLERVLNRLNSFESINLELSDQTIIVE